MDSGDPETAHPGGVFLSAEWRYLAMLNYEVDPMLLLPFVPPKTELDSWNGKTLISLVGFRFLNTRVLGIGFPFHRNFEEANLRFYVRRQHGTQVRRGVVFIREIVPRRLIAWVARSFYGERYVAMPMSHDIRRDDSGLSVEYDWKYKSVRNRIKLTATPPLAVPEAGSEEQFITEHYWGYAAQKDGACIEYQVQHPPWRVWAVIDASFDGNMEEIYGREFNSVLARAPASAFLAEGSAISVHHGRTLK